MKKILLFSLLTLVFVVGFGFQKIHAALMTVYTDTDGTTFTIDEIFDEVNTTLTGVDEVNVDLESSYEGFYTIMRLEEQGDADLLSISVDAVLHEIDEMGEVLPAASDSHTSTTLDNWLSDELDVFEAGMILKSDNRNVSFEAGDRTYIYEFQSVNIQQLAVLGHSTRIVGITNYDIFETAPSAEQMNAFADAYIESLNLPDVETGEADDGIMPFGEAEIKLWFENIIKKHLGWLIAIIGISAATLAGILYGLFKMILYIKGLQLLTKKQTTTNETISDRVDALTKNIAHVTRSDALMSYVGKALDEIINSSNNNELVAKSERLRNDYVKALAAKNVDEEKAEEINKKYKEKLLKTTQEEQRKKETKNEKISKLTEQIKNNIDGK